MCCETKRKIADGLIVILNDKPLKKVTVKDIMSYENMNRQSFYYHFQDIYGVIEWMFKEDFETKLAYDETETFEEWVEKALDVINDNKLFYRKVLESVDRERVIKDICPVIEVQMEQRLCECELNDDLKGFMVRSMCHYILDGVESEKEIQKEKIINIAYGIKSMLNNCQ